MHAAMQPVVSPAVNPRHAPVDLGAVSAQPGDQQLDPIRLEAVVVGQMIFDLGNQRSAVVFDPPT